MEKRTMIAVVLSVVLLVVWQVWFTPKQAEQPAAQQQQAQSQQQEGQPSKTAPAATQAAKAPDAKQAAAPVIEKKSTKQVIVETPKMIVTLGDLGGGITSVRLKEYKEKVDANERKELIENIAPYKYLPMVAQTAGNKEVTDATIFTADRDSVVVTNKPETLVFTGRLTNGDKIKKVYTFYPDTYTLDCAIQGEGLEKTSTYADFAVITLKEKSTYTFSGPFVYDGKKFQQVEKVDKPTVVGKAYNWTGFDEGYFSFIFMPKGTVKPELTITKVNDTPYARFNLAGGNLTSTLYFVPNKLSLLKQLNIHAEKIVDFGWFDILAKPMLWGMNWVNQFTRNYGIDIILLTILIKIIFYPLSVKSYKSMKEMQKMQPVIAKLKEKYKDDKQKLNQEMMSIYKNKGINPLGGCLPMVVQIPVFFALYKVLMAAIEFRHAPFLWWMNDLAAPENLYNLTVAGYTLPFRVLPLIMGITMVIQQKMTPTATADPMQEKMMMFMPIFFTFLFWGFPAGLVLYWLVNNVISIGQQYYINKKVA